MKKLAIVSLLFISACAITANQDDSPSIYDVKTESYAHAPHAQNYRIAFYSENTSATKLETKGDELFISFNKPVTITKPTLAKLQELSYPCNYTGIKHTSAYMTIILKCKDAKVYQEELDGVLDIIIVPK